MRMEHDQLGSDAAEDSAMIAPSADNEGRGTGPLTNQLISQVDGRARQRIVCAQLLEHWVPLATAEELEIRKKTKTKSDQAIDEATFEAGLKAGAFVLKVLERWARLDGL